jgi:hypothetical protein
MPRVTFDEGRRRIILGALTRVLGRPVVRVASDWPLWEVTAKEPGHTRNASYRRASGRMAAERPVGFVTASRGRVGGEYSSAGASFSPRPVFETSR